MKRGLIMAKNVLVIEAPGKRKKLEKFLGADWTVIATGGHIREFDKSGNHNLGFELTPKGTVIPKFVPRSERSKKVIRQLQMTAKRTNSERIFIATDPDREGECIGWHAAQVMGIKNPQRIVYSEISEKAVRRAIANPRFLDTNLVASALGRSTLDKLIGYTGSPLLWDYVEGAKSMGRVQTPVLTLICEREETIQNFKPETYYSVWSLYKEGLKAFYAGESNDNSEDSEEERDDSQTPKETQKESLRVTSEAEANRLVAIARNNSHNVVSLETKKSKKSPPAPFTTSNLQQAAGARLKFSPDQTMKLAQKLYEAGVITYHRTDSTVISGDFCKVIRQYLKANDPENLPKSVIKHRQSKNAQEAHEAIRPVDLAKTETDIASELGDAAGKLYQLIWFRTVASQCKPAELDKTTITTQSDTVFWKAKGQVVTFAGYLRYWRDLGADSELPSVENHQVVTLEDAQAEKKQTKPPSRFTEAQMVKVREKKGIGRPSTFSPTIQTLKDRNYVAVEKRMLKPTQVGLKVYHFVREHLTELGTVEFTAQMESHLDAIAKGDEKWQPYVCQFHFDHWQPTLIKIAQTLGKPAVKSFNGNGKSLEKSRTKCPKCNVAMSKVPSKSKKLHRPYFLKCEDCETVMFYNKERKQWESPGTKSPTQETKASCPKCQKPLHLREYRSKKDGKQKKLLKCLDCDDVVFFESRGCFWSKQFGEINL